MTLILADDRGLFIFYLPAPHGLKESAVIRQNQRHPRIHPIILINLCFNLFYFAGGVPGTEIAPSLYSATGPKLYSVGP